MADAILAPWTPEEVAALNRYQSNVMYHPYTCGNRGDSGHKQWGNDTGTLLATEDGWVCRDCDYTQDWAHAFSLVVADDANPFDAEIPDSFWVCGYRGITGICGKDQFCGCHTESYGPETFDKHRFVKGMWFPSG